MAHFGCVNAIEFSHGAGDMLVSGGDDRRVLLWDVEKHMAGDWPYIVMQKNHRSNIFCVSFSNDNSRVFSGGNDDVVIMHDIETRMSPDVFSHGKPVYGMSVDPTNNDRFATAGEDGRVLLFDVRTNDDTLQLKKHRGAFHAAEFHPMNGNYLLTANAKSGAACWDLRASLQEPFISYGGKHSTQSCMSVRFNQLGTQVLALRRRLPPILYPTLDEMAICQFYHSDYYNSCTMKSCCFAGSNDEYILSGSDDFNLYMWRIGDTTNYTSHQWVDKCHMVLYGHRSIVNQVRYNPEKCIIASSGVEKIVKLWSTFQPKGWIGSLEEDASGPENPRDVFTHEEYLSLVNHSGSNMTHDYSLHSTSEDPRMMAFFDSLVQREIEGWVSSISSESERSNSEASSSEMSSRPNSSTSSDSSASDDEVQQINYGQVCRRRRSSFVPKIPRKKYPNRIAYLIATKRNTLKRLALKGAAHSLRRLKAPTMRKRPTARLTRSGIGMRSGRMNNSLLGRRSNDGAGTSSNNIDGRDRFKKKRKYLQHRRKSSKKSIVINTTSGNDDDDDDDDDNNNSDDEHVDLQTIIGERAGATYNERGSFSASTSESESESTKEAYAARKSMLTTAGGDSASNCPVPSTSAAASTFAGASSSAGTSNSASYSNAAPPPALLSSTSASSDDGESMKKSSRNYQPVSRINGDSNQHFHPIPSTSTGITNTNNGGDKRFTMFRNMSNAQRHPTRVDSDDDDSDVGGGQPYSPQLHLPRIQVTWPRNGASRPNVYSSSGLDDNGEDVDADLDQESAENRLIFQPRHCRKRRHSHHHHHHHHSHNHASTSSSSNFVAHHPAISHNSSLSSAKVSSSGQETDDEYVHKHKMPLSTQTPPEPSAAVASGSSLLQHVTPDSGTEMTTDTSSGPHCSGPSNTRYNGDMRLFDKKIASVRRNYGNIFANDANNSSSE